MNIEFLQQQPAHSKWSVNVNCNVSYSLFGSGFISKIKLVTYGGSSLETLIVQGLGKKGWMTVKTLDLVAELKCHPS